MQLTKTTVKGLFLTENGKPYHKSAKREIIATKSNKIRFNGKTYDLTKIMQPTAKNRPKVPQKTVSVMELKSKGFVKTNICDLYVSKCGKAYNKTTNNSLTILRRGTVNVNGKGYNFAKVVLLVFGKIAIRNGLIEFINGNDTDFSFENLQYKCTAPEPLPHANDLITCIRLYFAVDKNFSYKSPTVKSYIFEIIKKRGFDWRCASCKDFDLFFDYFKNNNGINQISQSEVSVKFGYSVTNSRNAINKYLNLFISECLNDHENGLLQLQPFQAKPPTKTEILRVLQSKCNEWGFNIKIPLRKKSSKELLSDYRKSTKVLKQKIEKMQNEPPS